MAAPFFIQAVAILLSISPFFFSTDPTVEPIHHNGVIYTAKTDPENRGWIEACDEATGKKLWEKQIYRGLVIPNAKEEIYWKSIVAMRLQESKLIIWNSRSECYALDLNTKTVEFLRGKR